MMFKRLITLLGITVVLVACGGGDLQFANGGIGGTGISSGPISGFGSIYVNGVKYDVDNASFTRNDMASAGQEDFRVGEYVTIMGSVNADGVSGVAEAISYRNELEGVVTDASTDGVNISILWQSVRINALTTLHGFKQMTELVPGNVVEVSGVRDATGKVLATSLRLQQSTYTAGEVMQLSGTIQFVDAAAQTLQVENLIVDYASASLQGFSGLAPAEGQKITVVAVQALDGNRMQASEIKLQEAAFAAEEGVEIELEGIITRFTSSQDFAVNHLPVQVVAGTEFEQGTAADLSLNAIVEVEGEINAQGLLIADEIAIKTSDNISIGELEGSITAIDPTAKTFTLLGQDIEVNSRTLWEDESDSGTAQMNFTQLRVGDFVEVKTQQQGNGSLLALKVERENEESDDEQEEEGGEDESENENENEEDDSDDEAEE